MCWYSFRENCLTCARLGYLGDIEVVASRRRWTSGKCECLLKEGVILLNPSVLGVEAIRPVVKHTGSRRDIGPRQSLRLRLELVIKGVLDAVVIVSRNGSGEAVRIELRHG